MGWTRATLGLLAIASALGGASTAAATSPAERRIDPELRRHAREAPAGVIGAVLRLPSADPATLAALEARGVVFRRGDRGTLLHLGALYPVWGRASLLRTLADEGLWVAASRTAELVDPTASTGTEIGVWASHARGPVPLAGPTGRDITIVDLDNAIDLFHPHMFRADAGAHPWVDVDGDGWLTPGVDGIDANLDGTIEDRELLRLLDYAERTRGEQGYEYDGLDGTFDSAVDYLYVDFNGNGRRDYGAEGGYSEQTPGYGEAMFLPDDANGDRAIDTDERLLWLGTSTLSAYRRNSVTWRRGEDLIHAPRNTHDISDHGTSVIGILVGGQDRLFRRHRGLLPDADVILLSRYNGGDEASLIESIAWATNEEGGDVVLHEYASWYGHHLDGARPLDAAIDASVDDGVVHVCPAGNLQTSGKHAHVEGPAGASFPLTVPNAEYHSYSVNLHWDAAVELQCTLVAPGGEVLPIVEDSDQILGTASVSSQRWDSARGTALLELYVADPAGLTGSWSVDCTHDAPTLGIHAYLDDALTGWGRGVTFDQEVESSTMCSPSTADRCLAVAAYLWQHPEAYGQAAGTLAPYSSLGPRIDHGKTIDIAAPADPYAPWPSVEDPALGFEELFFQNNYATFGGTSGAGPHVAAVAALLRQEGGPVASGEEINQRIFDGAGTDGVAGSDAWGHGRLRAYGSLWGEEAPERPDYVAREPSVEFVPDDGTCIAMVTVPNVDWPDPSFRWDDDYDGTWDTEFIEGVTRELRLTEDAPALVVRVEYGQEGWRVGGAALTAEAPAACFEPFVDATGTGADSTTGLPEGTAGDTTGAPDEATTSGDGGASSAGDDGCGCTTGPRSGGLRWLVPLLVLGWRRRRAR